MISLFLVNNPAELSESLDSSGRLLRESVQLGHRCFAAAGRSVSWRNGAPVVFAAEVGEFGQLLSEFRADDVRRFDLVHVRLDPPVLGAFVETARILAAAEGVATFVNSPTVVATMCEKLVPFADLAPRSLVTSDPEEAQRFGESVGKTVLKPLYEACSRGVELLDWSPGQSAAARQRFSARTSASERMLLQEFLPQIYEGETRCWLVDGKPLGWLRKRIRRADFRFSISDGDTVEPWEPQERERIAVTQLGQWLNQRGVRLAAIDLIDGKITDVNITSPGLLVELDAVAGMNTARQLLLTLMASRPRY